MIAARSQDDGVRYAIIVGASLQERDQALASLSRLLLIGGPIALLLAALAAYWVARAALGPVDAMRRRAAEISDDDPGQRLPVGPADDEISELATTLNSMLAGLEEAIERERRFVADASHELRTPLTILKAEIDLALEEGRSPSELRSALVSGGEEVDGSLSSPTTSWSSLVPTRAGCPSIASGCPPRIWPRRSPTGSSRTSTAAGSPCRSSPIC